MTRLVCPWSFHDGGKSCESCACDVVRPAMPADTRYCLDCGKEINPAAKYTGNVRCHPCAMGETGRVKREARLRPVRRAS